MIDKKQILIDFYKSTAYTDNYIIGYTFKGRVYAGFMLHADALLIDLVKQETSSGKGGACIRYKQNDTTRALVNTHAFKVDDIGAVETLECECKNSKYNRGEIFERWIYERYTATEWHKDNRKYTTDADVVIEGIDYQIKYNKATFINEQTMESLSRKAQALHLNKKGIDNMKYNELIKECEKANIEIWFDDDNNKNEPQDIELWNTTIAIDRLIKANAKSEIKLMGEVIGYKFEGFEVYISSDAWEE